MAAAAALPAITPLIAKAAPFATLGSLLGGGRTVKQTVSTSQSASITAIANPIVAVSTAGEASPRGSPIEVASSPAAKADARAQDVFARPGLSPTPLAVNDLTPSFGEFFADDSAEAGGGINPLVLLGVGAVALVLVAMRRR